MKEKDSIKETTKLELKNLSEIQLLTTQEKLALKGGSCRDKRRPIRLH
jgi:hypothetical protein